MKPLTIGLATLAAVALATQVSVAQAAHGTASHGHVSLGMGATLHGPAVPMQTVHHPGFPGAPYHQRYYQWRYPRVYQPFPGHPPVVVPFPGHPPVVHPPVVHPPVVHPPLCRCPLCYPQRSFYYSGPGFHIGFAY